jgi:protein-arginine kinase activator protein McsA
MVLSKGESSLTKEKYRCSNCGGTYHRITATGHIAEASTVFAAVATVIGILVAVLGGDDSSS